MCRYSAHIILSLAIKETRAIIEILEQETVE